MGTTFVTLSRDVSGAEAGFWMRDGWLELWLRLLALHLPEPTDAGEHRETTNIRNRWLLASRVCFGGCVPHSMEDACATLGGREVVRIAINSLLEALQRSEKPIEAETINLLGLQNPYLLAVDRKPLIEIGWAFLDLLDERIIDGPSSTEIMPGSKPYKRADREWTESNRGALMR